MSISLKAAVNRADRLENNITLLKADIYQLQRYLKSDLVGEQVLVSDMLVRINEILMLDGDA